MIRPMSKGVIKKVAGPLVIAEGMRDANMFDVVRVSSQRLIGEIIEIHGDEASIQVYEETSGLGPGEPVESMDVPLSVELGPGLICQYLRRHPASAGRYYEKLSGNNFKRRCGSSFSEARYKVEFCTDRKGWGIRWKRGDIIGTVQETRDCRAARSWFRMA